MSSWRSKPFRTGAVRPLSIGSATVHGHSSWNADVPGKRRGAREGSIYRRPDGRWVGIADLGWTNGKCSRKFVYGATRRQATERLGELQRHLAAGAPPIQRQLTVGAYLEAWVSTTLPGTVRPSPEASYAHMIRYHIVPALGRKRLDRLSPEDVRSFLRQKALTPGTRGQPPSARTVQYIHAVRRRALEQARREELIARNVASLVQAPRVRHEEVVPLSPDEARALLEAARHDRLYALYAVAVAVGLRRGEALGLRWVDVDLDEGTLRVTGTLNRVGGRLTRSDPKTARSRRLIPLPDMCVAALRQHKQQQAAECAAAVAWVESGFVFTTGVGTPIEPRNVGRHLDGLCQKAGIRRIRFHDLRHTCASLLLAQGVEPRVIMDTLGHSMIGTTLNLYAHVMPVAQRDAASRMEAALRGGDR